MRDGTGHQDFGLLFLQACLDLCLPQKVSLIQIVLCPKVFYAVHDLNFRQKEFRLHKPRCSGDNLLGCAGLIFLKISLKLHRCLFCGDKRLTKHALISCQQWFRLLKPLNSAVKLRGLVSLNLMPISEVYTSFIS